MSIYRIQKQSGTYSELLETYGLANTLYRIFNSIGVLNADIVVSDKNVYYEITTSWDIDGSLLDKVVYFPMQHIRTINCQHFALLNGTSLIFTITLKVLGNSMCWFSNFSIYVLYRIFSAHLRKSQINFRGLIWWVLPHWGYKCFAEAKI